MNKIVFEDVLYYGTEDEEELLIQKLEIPKQSFFCLLGEEDEFKKDVLELVMGIKLPKEGRITIDNNEEKGIKELKRYVPDGVILEGNMTAKEYLQLFNNKNYNKKLESLLCDKIFKINTEQNLLEMTYQENKLIMIIAAISSSPEILLLDDPSKYLEKNKMNMLFEVLELLRQKGMTIIIASKYKDVSGFGTDYAYIESGKIISSGKAILEKDLWKVVTVINPKKDIMDEEFYEMILDREDKRVYLYKGKNRELLNEIIYDSACEDFKVDTISFEAWIKKDFSEWM